MGITLSYDFSSPLISYNYAYTAGCKQPLHNNVSLKRKIILIHLVLRAPQWHPILGGNRNFLKVDSFVQSPSLIISEIEIPAFTAPEVAALLVECALRHYYQFPLLTSIPLPSVIAYLKLLVYVVCLPKGIAYSALFRNLDGTAWFGYHTLQNINKDKVIHSVENLQGRKFLEVFHSNTFCKFWKIERYTFWMKTSIS